MATTDTNMNSPNGGSKQAARNQPPADEREDRRQGQPDPQRSLGQGMQSEPSRAAASRAAAREGQRPGTGRGVPQLRSGSPFASFMQLSREMDNLMESLLGRGFGGALGRQGGEAGGAPTLFSPSIDVRRRGNDVVITADLPGVSRENVSIECGGDGITISGRREESREENDRDGDYHFSERSYGSFYRAIPLPDAAQTDQAKAQMRDGVLEITVPLREDQQRRRIEIGS